MRKLPIIGSWIGPLKFYKGALVIVVPIVLQSLIGSLVSLVDNFMVAGLGDAKMASVNIANQVTIIYYVLVQAVAIAGGIYLAQNKGAGSKEGMQQAFRFKILLALALFAIYTAICYLFPEELMHILLSRNRDSDEIAILGAQYLRILALSNLPMAIALCIATSLRDVGNTKVPLVISMITVCLNTLLNWLLIYGELGFPRLETDGAAVATNIARTVEALSLIIYLMWEKNDFAFPLAKLFKVNMKIFLAILQKSSLLIFSDTAWIISETIIAAIYNSRGGAETVAGMSAGFAIANLFFIVFNAIYPAGTIIVGATLGSGKLNESRLKARWIYAGAVILGFAFGLIAVLTTFLIDPIFYKLTPESRAIAHSFVLIIAIYLPLWVVLNAQFAISRAGGDLMLGVYADVGASYILFIPLAFILAHFTTLGPVAIFGYAKLSDLLKFFLAYWWLKKERWVKNLSYKEEEKIL